MEPDSKEKDNFDLPPLQAEGGQSVAEQPQDGIRENAAAKGIEQGVPMPPPMPPPSDDGAQASYTATHADGQMRGSADPYANTTGMPQIADDTDLIEKEWVDKAKAIVEQTAHDPYLQNQEINKVKVDYLKKRYNKDVKLSDD